LCCFLVAIESSILQKKRQWKNDWETLGVVLMTSSHRFRMSKCISFLVFTLLRFNSLSTAHYTLSQVSSVRCQRLLISTVVVLSTCTGWLHLYVRSSPLHWKEYYFVCNLEELAIYSKKKLDKGLRTVRMQHK
jgi:hypothetical protein